MSKEDLKIKLAEQKELEVKPVEQDVKEEDLKDVNGGGCLCKSQKVSYVE